MSYVRIDNLSDVDQAYSSVIQNFGKGILNDKYRMLGALLDIAPKMKDEAKHLAIAFDVEVPQYFVNATSLDKETAKGMISKLQGKGLSNDEAIEMLETLGAATGVKVNIRPDYSRGGTIPYAASKGDDLHTAIRKMDHIRWFLNNAGKYQMKGVDAKVKELRKLFNNPQKNESQLIMQYKDLAHEFLNDPYEASFSFGDHKGAAITSKDFGAYFVVIDSQPVAIEFARQYGGDDYQKSLRSLGPKREGIVKKAAAYKTKAENINIPSGSDSGKGKAIGFIIAALIVLGAVRWIFGLRWGQTGAFGFLNMLFKSHFAIGKAFRAMASLSYTPAYATILIVSTLMLVCMICLIVGIIKTIANVSKVKSNNGPITKRASLIRVFDQQVQSDLKKLSDEMDQYTKGKKTSLNLPTYDYSRQVKDLNDLAGRSFSGGGRVFVRSGAKTAMGWLIFLTVVSLIMSATKMNDLAQNGTSEMGRMMSRSSDLGETVIPINAMEYNGHYYAIFDDATTFNDAYYRCIRMGGHMVSIQSEDEDIAVATYLKESSYDNAYIGTWYEGGYWYWIGYEPLSYMDWTIGEPDLGDNYDCIYGAMCGSDGYQWRALSESYLTTYICEWDSAEAGIVDPRILDIPMEAMEYNGHYYAIYTDAEDYNEAVELCLDRGGYICVINDATEDVELYNYCVERGYGTVFFGFTDQDLEGKWKWDETGGYSDCVWWSPGEPNGGVDENYGCFYDGSEPTYWNDAYFGYNSPYLCEWDLTQPAE